MYTPVNAPLLSKVNGNITSRYFTPNLSYLSLYVILALLAGNSAILRKEEENQKQ
jgi:hypothetical protein